MVGGRRSGAIVVAVVVAVVLAFLVVVGDVVEPF